MRTRSEKLLIELIESSLSVLRENKMWGLLDSAVIVEQLYLMKKKLVYHTKKIKPTQPNSRNKHVRNNFKVRHVKKNITQLKHRR